MSYQLPDTIKDQPMASGFQDDPLGETDSLTDGIGQSYPVIGYKGKTWTLRSRGEKKYFVRPDDGTQAPHIDVVIVLQAKNRSKTYYPGPWSEASSEGDRPVCSSMDGIVPDMDVKERQHTNCTMCPHNTPKPNPQTGRKSKACRDNKRLAVLIMPPGTTPGTPKIDGVIPAEPALLRVPADSLNALGIAGAALDKQNKRYYSVVMRISFDPAKSHPSMIFTPILSLTNKEAPYIMEMRKDAGSGYIVDGPGSHGMKAIAQEMVELPSTNGSLLSHMQEVSPPVEEAPPKPGLQTAADVGLPEEADEDLDSKVAKFIASRRSM